MTIKLKSEITALINKELNKNSERMTEIKKEQNALLDQHGVLDEEHTNLLNRSARLKHILNNPKDIYADLTDFHHSRMDFGPVFKFDKTFSNFNPAYPFRMHHLLMQNIGEPAKLDMSMPLGMKIAPLTEQQIDQLIKTIQNHVNGVPDPKRILFKEIQDYGLKGKLHPQTNRDDWEAFKAAVYTALNKSMKEYREKKDSEAYTELQNKMTDLITQGLGDCTLELSKLKYYGLAGKMRNMSFYKEPVDENVEVLHIDLPSNLKDCNGLIDYLVKHFHKDPSVQHFSPDTLEVLWAKEAMEYVANGYCHRGKANMIPNYVETITKLLFPKDERAVIWENIQNPPILFRHEDCQTVSVADFLESKMHLYPTDFPSHGTNASRTDLVYNIEALRKLTKNIAVCLDGVDVKHHHIVKELILSLTGKDPEVYTWGGGTVPPKGIIIVNVGNEILNSPFSDTLETLLAQATGERIAIEALYA